MKIILPVEVLLSNAKYFVPINLFFMNILSFLSLVDYIE